MQKSKQVVIKETKRRFGQWIGWIEMASVFRYKHVNCKVNGTKGIQKNLHIKCFLNFWDFVNKIVQNSQKHKSYELFFFCFGYTIDDFAVYFLTNSLLITLSNVFELFGFQYFLQFLT